ncbi:MAG: hypothetical protein HQ523_15295 [Lentisphaerae bacterium]|nr:hypothetical protein [Lentisphaerota bacterium]
MRGKVVVVGLLLSVLMVMSVQAGLNVGGKIWVEELTIGVGGDEGTVDGVAVGPTVSLDLGDSLWVSGSWLVGLFDLEDGDNMTTQDAEAVLAMSFDWLDIGVGFRYSVDQISLGGGTEDAVKMGPMAYAGVGSSFGDSPIGWYAAGSWMFYDLADDWVDGGGKHYNVEGGLSRFLDPLTATVGYRYKDHYDIDGVDFTYAGITATAGFSF